MAFGDRWPGLREALLRPGRQIFRYNRFLSSVPGGGDFAPGIAEWCGSPGRHPVRSSDGLLDGYVMDPASWWAAKALDVQPGDDVLDLCAAPGGKSLILAEDLREEGTLIANEPSDARRESLMSVIRQYIPRDVRERVRVTGRDGARWGMHEPEAFDRILVDAPCSGERHLLERPSEMSEWSPRRSEGLAARQYALLCSALLALRGGGRLVYSTCALSPLENGDVVAKFLKKKGERVRPVDLPLPEEAERVSGGVQFFPDRCGYGPIFYAAFEKTAEGE